MRFLYLAGLLVVSRILRDLQIVSRVLRGLRALPAVPGQVPETEIIAKHISQVARDAASGDIASADQVIAHLRDVHRVEVRLVKPTDDD